MKVKRNYLNSSATKGIVCIGSLAIMLSFGLLCFLPWAWGSDMAVQHVDMNEIAQYQDNLSPEEYDNLLEKARQTEMMIQASLPIATDTNNYKYKQAARAAESLIRSLRQEAQQMAEERLSELDQATLRVNEEFDRVDRTFESYTQDLTDQQKDELDNTMQGLLKKWKDPQSQKKNVNEGIKDCSEFLQKLKEVNDKIVDFSMTRMTKTIDEERPDSFVPPKPDENNKEAKEAYTPPKLPFYDYRVSPYWKSTTSTQSAESQLAQIQKNLEGLRDIKVLGTLEYDSLSKELKRLLDLSNQLKGQDGKYSGKNEQILLEKIKDLEKAIHKASGN